MAGRVASGNSVESKDSEATNAQKFDLFRFRRDEDNNSALAMESQCQCDSTTGIYLKHTIYG